MSFIETRFPETIAYGASGGLGFKTDIIENFAGFEQRNISWSIARGKWTVSYNNRDNTTLDILKDFFNAMHGRAYGFRFKDWSDYQGLSEQIAVGDNSITTFQLIKNYTQSTQTYIREIKKPVLNTIIIYFDGVEQNVGWSVDLSTGIITFDTAPLSGVIITADYEFDVPVRFDTDQMQIEMNLPNGAGSWNDIPLIEIKI